MTDREMLQEILNKVNTLDDKVTILEKDVSGLKHEVKRLDLKVEQNTLTIENTVNRCLKIMGEGYELISERIDRCDIDVIKNQSNMALYFSKLTNEKVDRLIEKLNHSA